jgi:succinate dehydrogenase / fumarate reductase cytochrome b subunit
MKQLTLFLCSSIGKKSVMAITGLIWSGFVLSHMIGNLLIFVSAEAYNKYSHMLISNPAIYIAEGALLVTILVHAFDGMKLSWENRQARPERYAVSPSPQKGASVASKSMIFTGSLMFAFLIYHLITFKFGPYFEVTYDGVVMRDIFKVVVEVFQNPLYVAGYVVCMVFVGLHLSHGFQSSFQSLGFYHPKYSALIKKFGCFYSFIVAAGFIAQPIYVFFVY